MSEKQKGRFICFLLDNGSNLVADSGQEATVAAALSAEMNYFSDEIWSNLGKMGLKSTDIVCAKEITI